MKKVIIALTAIIAMASCKKENVTTVVTPIPVPTVTKNLAKYTNSYDNATPETEIYTYDAQGRIAEIKKDDRTVTFNFVSATSLVETQRWNTNNNIIVTQEYSINDKGYVTKIIKKSPAGVPYFTLDYTYNADGYMTSQKGTYDNGSSFETVYVITDGNVVSSKNYTDNILTSDIIFSYDNTKMYKTGFNYNFGGNWRVKNLFGRCSKNMLNEYKYFNASGTLTYHLQFAYELDTDGYTVKQTANYVLQGKQRVNTFSYQ
jgi:YD repeat-containing protein